MTLAGAGEPSRGDRLLPGVELDGFGSLHVQIPEEGLVPAGEGEPGHGGGDADVDADHAGVEVLLELPGGVAAAGEDGGAVAIGTAAADVQGLFERGGADDREDGAEDFLGGDFHAGLDAVDDGGAEEEAEAGGGGVGGGEGGVGAFGRGGVEINGGAGAGGGGGEGGPG